MKQLMGNGLVTTLPAAIFNRSNIRTIHYTARLLVVLASVWMLSGCMTNAEGYRAPGLDLKPSQYYYLVIEPKDEREVYKLIEQELRSRRFNITSGPKDAKPHKTDIVIRYSAKWVWDITWYLLEMKIRFYDKDNLLVGSGHTLRTSLARKEPDLMVKDTVDQLVGAVSHNK